MRDVVLTWQEMTTAGLVGFRRQISAMAGGQENWGNSVEAEEAPFDCHIIGAMAEFAGAKTLNLFWADGVGKRNDPDIGGLIEVRSRRVNGAGLDLPLRDRDFAKKPDVPFMLVHSDVRNRKFTMAGWIICRDGWALTQSTDKLRFVPRERLRPFEELEALVDQIKSTWATRFSQSA